MAKTCGFCDCMRDLLIIDRLLLGISDGETREKLLSTHDLFLNKAIEIFQALEAASHHTKAPKRDEIKEIKDILKKTKKFCLDKHQYETKKSPRGDDQKSLKKKSLFYLQIHVLKKERHPAWGKTCVVCGERNPFKASRRCKHQGVNSLADDYSSGSSESTSGTISTVTAHED